MEIIVWSRDLQLVSDHFCWTVISRLFSFVLTCNIPLSGWYPPNNQSTPLESLIKQSILKKYYVYIYNVLKCKIIFLSEKNIYIMKNPIFETRGFQYRVSWRYPVFNFGHCPFSWLESINQLFLRRECPILERIPLLSSSSILLDRSWFKPDLEFKLIYRVSHISTGCPILYNLQVVQQYILHDIPQYIIYSVSNIIIYRVSHIFIYSVPHSIIYWVSHIIIYRVYQIIIYKVYHIIN